VEPPASYWNTPCQFGCGYMHLQSATNEKMKCCIEGSVNFAVTKYPLLYPLPSNIKLIFENTKNFSRISSTYNNILAMGATGVDNGKGGGFENNMHGDHAVKLNGSTYHFIPPAYSSTTEPSGGLSYFIFDAQAAMLSHANLRNNGNNGIGTDRIDESVLMQLYDDLRTKNYLCQELLQIGQHVNNAERSRHLTADINASITYFEVAQITDDAVSGNRILRIQLKDATSTSNCNSSY